MYFSFGMPRSSTPRCIQLGILLSGLGCRGKSLSMPTIFFLLSHDYLMLSSFGSMADSASEKPPMPFCD